MVMEMHGRCNCHAACRESRPTMIRIATLLGFLAVFGAATLLYYVRYQPDAQAYPIQGIDVSHHQGPIRWPEVARGGISFAYIKATEGADYKDRRFLENWTNAAKAGVARGAYHFFSLCRPGLEQARNFIATVPSKAGDLPPAIDLEFGGNCSIRPAMVVVKASVATLVEQLQVAYKKTPILYVTRDFYDAYGQALPEHARFWIRSIAWPPAYGGRSWTLWQYHNRGRVLGVDGPVDRNVFNGSETEFRAFVTIGEQLTLSDFSR